MKFRVVPFFIAGIIIFLAACERPPNLSTIPSIGFANVEFVEQFPAGTDSLYLTLRLEDGDGDLGLESNDIESPYNPLFYFDSITGNPQPDFFPAAIRYGYFNARGEPIRTANPQFDSLPNYEFPIYCEFYESVFRNVPLEAGEELILIPDTLKFDNDTIIRVEDIYYVQRNQNHNNIFVKFFIEQGGQFVEFDFSNILPGSCNLGYDARFPLLTDELTDEPTLQGELRYAMLATSWRGILRNNNIKLQFFIKDRQLNNSNMVETPAFTLDEVKIN